MSNGVPPFIDFWGFAPYPTKNFLERKFPSRALPSKNFINLINLNPLNFDKNAVLTPPSRDVAMAFMDAVIKSGVSCTMRKNKGDDIDGACGQLRLRHFRQHSAFLPTFGQPDHILR